MTVNLEPCPRCGADTLTSTRDLLGDVAASITVDPTPLAPGEQAACVLTRRRLYRFEAAAGGGLGIMHWATGERAMGEPDVVLPEHVCGRVFSVTPLTVGQSIRREVPAWLSE